jgi:hypothetical protein
VKPLARYQPYRVAILPLMTLVGLFLFFSSATLPAQTQEDRNWVNRNSIQALDELMPIKKSEGYYVAYRSRPDLLTEILEYSFLIGYDPNENQPGLQAQLSAHVRTADSVSVYDQMMKMHRANPREGLASIKRKIRVKAWDLNESNCPAVRTQFDKLEKVGFGPLEFLAIWLDAPSYEFRIQAGAGDFDMTLFDETHPLVQWALETRHALESCTGEPNTIVR